MNKMKQNNQGFITWIIIIVIALALAKYFFDFNIFSAANSPKGVETTNYVKQVLDTIWFYISRPVMYIWNNVVVDMLWKVFLLGWHELQIALSKLPTR